MRFSLIVAGLAMPVVAVAQGRLIPVCGVPDDGPRVVIACGAQVWRTQSAVRGRLDGRVVHYVVDEAFTNRGGRLGEADYLFPLPPGAAFRNLRLSINGQMVAGEVMDAAHARSVYEEIVRTMRDPALVEWMGSGLLRTRIFPILPGETKRVSVEFDAVVPREGDALRIDYSRGQSVGRYDGRSGGQEPAAAAGSADSYVLRYARSEPLGRPYSPSNGLTMRDSAGMHLVEARDRGANVMVLIPLLLGDRAAITVLTHGQQRDSGFAMITISPPRTHERASARDVTFVIDVSGSMSGTKMQQARAAGRALLGTLQPADRFRLISFSSDVQDFRSGFVYATGDNLAAGTRYLDGLSANGGTNIGAALDDALRGQTETANRLRLVLFLTDGQPTVGETNVDRITEQAQRERGDARLFTFGLGADVNSALLERLSMDGRGTAQFVRPDENVERMVSVVAERLTDPVATDLRVRVDGHDVQLRDMVPSMPMDLFGGQDLVVMARYAGAGAARVTVEGRSHGHAVRWTSDAQFADVSAENGFIPRLWAAQRIGYLSAERRRSGANAEVDGEIRALGERYGIPTEFTSYLVQEPQHAVVGTGMVRRDANGGVVRGSATQPTMMMAAPEPQAAFEAAKMASAQRAAISTAVLDSMSIAAGGSDGTTRTVAGHTFAQRDGRWVDSRYADSTRTVHVQAFSKTYFALLDRIPELRAMAVLGARVVMVGRGVAIEVVAQAPELSDADLNRVVSAW